VVASVDSVSLPVEFWSVVATTVGSVGETDSVMGGATGVSAHPSRISKLPRQMGKRSLMIP